MLTAEEILKAKDCKIVPFDAPEWGGVIFLRTFTAKGADAIEEASLAVRNTGKTAGIRSLFAVNSICDEEGNLTFQNGQAELLEEKNGDIMTRIMREAMKLNAITEEEIDELEKN